MMRWIVMLAVGCGGTSYRDCPPEAAHAVAVVSSDWPDVVEVLDRADVVCLDADPIDGAPCVYDWYGTTVARGRMRVRADLAGPCVVHEAMHARLWLRGDECRTHDDACGWDADEIERVTAEVKAHGP